MPTSKFPFEEMQSLINRLEDKLDNKLNKIEDKVQEVSVVTIKNSVVLDEHMRRTAAAERSNELLEEKVELQKQELAVRIDEMKITAAARFAEYKKRTLQLESSLEGITSLPSKAYKAAKWITSIAAAGGVIFSVLKFIFKVI